jgi:hypothetical protein
MRRCKASMDFSDKVQLFSQLTNFFNFHSCLVSWFRYAIKTPSTTGPDLSTVIYGLVL